MSGNIDVHVRYIEYIICSMGSRCVSAISAHHSSIAGLILLIHTSKPCDIYYIYIYIYITKLSVIIT